MLTVDARVDRLTTYSACNHVWIRNLRMSKSLLDNILEFEVNAMANSFSLTLVTLALRAQRCSVVVGVLLATLPSHVIRLETDRGRPTLQDHDSCRIP